MHNRVALLEVTNHLQAPAGKCCCSPKPIQIMVAHFKYACTLVYNEEYPFYDHFLYINMLGSCNWLLIAFLGWL